MDSKSKSIKNDTTTALAYFESNPGLAQAALARYRTFVGPMLPREDWEQIALKCFWIACLTYDPQRAQLTTWAYRIAWQRGLREILEYVKPDFHYLCVSLIPDTCILGRIDDQIDGETLFALLDEYIANGDRIRGKYDKDDINSREAEVLLRRARGETLKDIGRSLDITRERVRQVEQRALLRLKNSFHSGHAKLIH